MPIENSHFQSLISLDHYKDLREKRLNQIHDRISAIALAKDEVIPPSGVANNLLGRLQGIKTKVDVLDFEYPYNHVTPFPLLEKFKSQVDNSFNQVMEKAAAFLY